MVDVSDDRGSDIEKFRGPSVFSDETFAPFRLRVVCVTDKILQLFLMRERRSSERGVGKGPQQIIYKGQKCLPCQEAIIGDYFRYLERILGFEPIRDPPVGYFKKIIPVYKGRQIHVMTGSGSDALSPDPLRFLSRNANRA
ncbi:MAG: hypothetical protein V1764_02830 [Nitrospirota bacterium]